MTSLAEFVRELDLILEENKKLKARVAELEAQPLDNKPKLSDAEVNDIRAAFRGGMSQRDLADAYGVNSSTISRTIRGIYH